jgi:hypothetical protein
VRGPHGGDDLRALRHLERLAHEQGAALRDQLEVGGTAAIEQRIDLRLDVGAGVTR